MTRPDPNHAPTWAETQWLSSPAAEREWQSRRTWLLLLTVGAAGAATVLFVALLLGGSLW